MPEKPKPIYPLKKIKQFIEENKVYFNWDTIDAYEDFGWRDGEIKRCILKFNDRYHLDDREKNHFFKTELHRIERLNIDVYKAVNIMEGNNVYAYLYIDPYFDRLVIYSFKELDYL